MQPVVSAARLSVLDSQEIRINLLRFELVSAPILAIPFLNRLLFKMATRSSFNSTSTRSDGLLVQPATFLCKSGFLCKAYKCIISRNNQHLCTSHVRSMPDLAL